MQEDAPIPKTGTIQYAKELLKKEGYTIGKKITEKRDNVFHRFPLLFTLLGTFGLVATLYGFEGIMDEIGLTEKPYIMLGVGIVILITTGSLYKTLSK